MICPNCDAMLGGGICQGCGWRTGNPWPASRLVAGSTHPMKARELYPPEITGTHNDRIVLETSTADEKTLDVNKKTVAAIVSELASRAPGDPAAENEALPKKPLDKSVQ